MPKTLDVFNVILRASAALALLSIAISTGVLTYHIEKVADRMDFAIEGVQKDVHQSLSNLDKATATLNTSVKDTSSMVNANLIHMDIIMGRTERISRKEEFFWDQFSLKSLETLDHANYTLAGVEGSIKGSNIILDTMSKKVDKSLELLTGDIHDNLTKSQVTFTTADHAIQSADEATVTLNKLLKSPSIQDTFTNIQESTAHISSTTDHVDHMASNLDLKVREITHPNRVKRFETFVLNLLGAGAHASEIFFYLK